MTKFTKVLVCGGRGYSNYNKVEEVLTDLQNSIGRSIFVITGGATGADSLAEKFAKNYGLPCAIVPAIWTVYGRSAGPIRNEWMLTLNPEWVVAFPGGNGTANMVQLAKDNKINCIKVDDPTHKDDADKIRS
tara:strand:- start:14864 stop:15259 length:396 start_codon:yes stop_codon:yes gene_type:complete